MSLEIVIFLLLVVLVAVSIPVVVYFFAGGPGSQPGIPWLRRRQPARRFSAEEVGALKAWYAGKSCVFCSQPIGPIHGEPRPGLQERETHRTLSWQDLPTGNLAAALERCHPVCASCLTAEAFRTRYPDRVVDRAPTSLRDSAMH